VTQKVPRSAEPGHCPRVDRRPGTGPPQPRSLMGSAENGAKTLHGAPRKAVLTGVVRSDYSSLHSSRRVEGNARGLFRPPANSPALHRTGGVRVPAVHVMHQHADAVGIHAGRLARLHCPRSGQASQGGRAGRRRAVPGHTSRIPIDYASSTPSIPCMHQLGGEQTAGLQEQVAPKSQSGVP
jgi:hypothetical protein